MTLGAGNKLSVGLRRQYVNFVSSEQRSRIATSGNAIELVFAYFMSARRTGVRLRLRGSFPLLWQIDVVQDEWK